MVEYLYNIPFQLGWKWAEGKKNIGRAGSEASVGEKMAKSSQ
jgi:hypothetical protein